MGIETALGDNILTTKVGEIANWARKNSLWPMPFGTACCAIEFMSVVSAHYDLARFGAEVVRFSPRQNRQKESRSQFPVMSIHLV